MRKRKHFHGTWLAASALALAALCAPASAREVLSGPVAAEVLRAVDGDTIEVRATIWIGQQLVTAVRIRGIDAPEVRGKCPREKTMAAAAKKRLGEVALGNVSLSNVENDKYGGRVVADVTTADGSALAELMLSSGLVRTYDGSERAPWCGLAGAG